MESLGREAQEKTTAYFTGGATAVLMGWRLSTIDVDVRFEPESDSILRAIPQLKERLRINIELASPKDFIPVLDDWTDRSMFIETQGLIAFFHFDIYAQALAKVERGHQQDLEDVREMIQRGLVEPVKAVEYFEAIEPNLYRYPALDPRTFRQSVEESFGGQAAGTSP